MACAAISMAGSQLKTMPVQCRKATAGVALRLQQWLGRRLPGAADWRRQRIKVSSMANKLSPRAWGATRVARQIAPRRCFGGGGGGGEMLFRGG
jgi:hypothetical protein